MTKLNLFLLALLAVLLTPLAANAAPYVSAPEPYASYDAQTRCKRAPQPGTRELATWLARQFKGGRPVTTVRACGGSPSEHKDGRAIDWMMDVRKKGDRIKVRAFLDRIFAADADDNPHALARRMGIMYVIWNDRMWASYDRFRVKPYPGCKKLRRCSATLRHRDHVHISLSKAGGRGATSWYVARR